MILAVGSAVMYVSRALGRLEPPTVQLLLQAHYYKASSGLSVQTVVTPLDYTHAQCYFHSSYMLCVWPFCSDMGT